jgi:tellurite resistance protein TehA-like permease
MGTGIVSIGLALDGWIALSRVLLAIAVVLWVGIAGVFARRAVSERQRWLEELRSPAALTTVAGTAVLGARLTQLAGVRAAEPFLVVTLCAWIVMVPSVLRHWSTPTVGVSFVLTVATQSVAVLGALVAIDRPAASLGVAALIPLVLGAVAYLVVLAEADPRQLLVGRGDHWIAGGALAITTLACARIAEALRLDGTLPALQPALRDATVVLWVVAAAWLPVLVLCELLWPRLEYETRRWSTVFPTGMYAVSSLAAGSVTGVRALTAFGRVWIWIAFTVWTVVFVGMLRRGGELLVAATAPSKDSSAPPLS